MKLAPLLLHPFYRCLRHVEESILPQVTAASTCKSQDLNPSSLVSWSTKLYDPHKWGGNEGYVRMWELDHKEGWAPENWCFQIVVLEKTLWDSLGQYNNQSGQSYRKWTLNIHWKDWYWSCSSSTLANWCREPTLWKRPWCRETLMGKGVTEHEMVRQQHWLNGHELEQILGDSEGQGRLACCSAWGHKESDTT